ncbi:MAG TPA: ferrochelatase [Acidimicrobiales bacterium]|nr:ferrochelatase [Acidimicrobiales bacterium]
MSDAPPTGVLVMAYGTPATPDDVEAYYTHVRRGRPPSPEQLADLQRRYDAIGGTSPLLAVTRAQADGLAAVLGEGWHVALGMKHAPPFIEDGMAALAARGVRQVIGLVLAPHYSALSVGEYAARVRASDAVVNGGVELTMVESWHLEPGYLDLLAGRVSDARSRLGDVDPERVEVVFTAHSLPARILDSGDPYPAQLADTAAAVAALLHLPRWSVAWQSAGRTSEPWMGPDVLEVLAALAQDSAQGAARAQHPPQGDGVDGVVVCACGFVSDHLEVLFDLDVEASQAAARLGVAFARTASLNDDPAFCATLADVVRSHAAASGPERPPERGQGPERPPERGSASASAAVPGA